MVQVHLENSDNTNVVHVRIEYLKVIAGFTKR